MNLHNRTFVPVFNVTILVLLRSQEVFLHRHCRLVYSKKGFVHPCVLRGNLYFLIKSFLFETRVS